MKCCLATAVHAMAALGRARPAGPRRRSGCWWCPTRSAAAPSSRPLIEAAARAADACLVLEAARPGGGIVTGRGAVGAMRIVATGSGRHVTDPGERRQRARAARGARRPDREPARCSATDAMASVGRPGRRQRPSGRPRARRAAGRPACDDHGAPPSSSPARSARWCASAPARRRRRRSRSRAASRARPGRAAPDRSRCTPLAASRSRARSPGRTRCSSAAARTRRSPGRPAYRPSTGSGRSATTRAAASERVELASIPRLGRDPGERRRRNP